MIATACSFGSHESIGVDSPSHRTSRRVGTVTFLARFDYNLLTPTEGPKTNQDGSFLRPVTLPAHKKSDHGGLVFFFFCLGVGFFFFCGFGSFFPSDAPDISAVFQHARP